VKVADDTMFSTVLLLPPRARTCACLLTLHDNIYTSAALA
jgi:hypothetical protein